MNVPPRPLWVEVEVGDLLVGHFDTPCFVVSKTRRSLGTWNIVLAGEFGVRTWVVGHMAPISREAVLLRLRSDT